jgi:hypothetical protein
VIEDVGAKIMNPSVGDQMTVDYRGNKYSATVTKVTETHITVKCNEVSLEFTKRVDEPHTKRVKGVISEQ